MKYHLTLYNKYNQQLYYNFNKYHDWLSISCESYHILSDKCPFPITISPSFWKGTLDMLMLNGLPKCQTRCGSLDVRDGNSYFIDLFVNIIIHQRNTNCTFSTSLLYLESWFGKLLINVFHKDVHDSPICFYSHSISFTYKTCLKFTLIVDSWDINIWHTKCL